MRRIVVGLVLVALVSPGGVRAHDDHLVDHVDPFIGTLGAGFVFPGPAAPYGMVQLSPDTDGYFAYTGYQYADTRIRGFSHVHTQSMGVPEGGEIPFMPHVGEVVTDVRTYQQPFSHATEEASPGYYAVSLASGVRAELTAGPRVGVHRYRFPADGRTASVLIDAGRYIADADPDANLDRPPVYAASNVQIAGNDSITGSISGRYTVHFAARFDRPFASFGTWSRARGVPEAGTRTAAGVGAGAFATFDFDYGEQRTVRAKVGISFVDVDNAQQNLDAELPGDDFDFEAVRARTRAAWEEALRAIVVEGGTFEQKRSFYTALYHAQHHPNIFNDVNGEYRGYDRLVHSIYDAPMNGRPYYANYSFWDTYRAEMPLLMLIAPDRVRDMMRSLAAIVEQGGRLPRWGWMDRYADFMIGEPALPVFADAACRGLVPQDVFDTLYGSARDLALLPERHRNPEFLSKGYTVDDASKTLEHATAAFALALVADANGRPESQKLASLAGNWRNVFDPETRFMRPRNHDGSWFSTVPGTGIYRPESPERWKEGTGWQYTWLVPHDVGGLFDAMGDGGTTALTRLGEFFAGALLPYAGPEAQQKLTAYGIAYAGDQYAPSNEHDLQAPWLFNWTSMPWKTQELQRSLQSLYRATPDGLPGNDDLGTMSAWFVWSALGFYPVIPGANLYMIGSPLFERARVSLPGGTFTVEAPGASPVNKFIRASTFDGVRDDRRAWRVDDGVDPFHAGGVARFEMGATPTDWGGLERPPSQSLENGLDAFGCDS